MKTQEIRIRALCTFRATPFGPGRVIVRKGESITVPTQYGRHLIVRKMAAPEDAVENLPTDVQQLTPEETKTRGRRREKKDGTGTA